MSPQPPRLPPKNKFKFPAKSLDNLECLESSGSPQAQATSASLSGVCPEASVPYERCQSYATNRDGVPVAFDDNNLGRGYAKTPFESETSVMFTSSCSASSTSTLMEEEDQENMVRIDLLGYFENFKGSCI